MNSKLDALLKVTLVVSALFASSAVGYYYLGYLPERDARLAIERRQQAEEEKRAQQERQEAIVRAQQAQEMAKARAQQEREDAEVQRQASEKATVQAQYQTCLSYARLDYEANWAGACKRWRALSVEGKLHCNYDANTQKTVCDPKKLPDPNDCALPREKARDFKSDLEKAKDRCLQETRAGLTRIGPAPTDLSGLKTNSLSAQIDLGPNPDPDSVPAMITFKFVDQPGGAARADVGWSILSLSGDVLFESDPLKAHGVSPSVSLYEGDYRAIVRTKNRTYESNFKVVSGTNREVEVLAK
jgi:hypothetical protein